MNLWRLLRGDPADAPSLTRGLRWWRVRFAGRWQPTWAAGSALLAVETRRAMGQQAGPGGGPYRDGRAAELTGPRRLASLVYVGETSTDRPVVRRLEIDPEHGKPYLLWEARMPRGARLDAGGFGRLGGLLLAPGSDGLHARDLFTMRRRWHLPCGGPAVDLLSLASGELWVRTADGATVVVDPVSGEPRELPGERRSAAAEIARGARPVHDPHALPADTLLFDGAALEVRRGGLEVRELADWRPAGASLTPRRGRHDIPGWSVLGPVMQVEEALLAWVVDDNDRYGVATLDVRTLTVRLIAEVGRLVAARVIGMYALDGVGVVRVALGRGDAAARRTWVVEPDTGRLIAWIDSDGELIAENWRSHL